MGWVRWFTEIDHDDAQSVGCKNAALGEVARHLAPLGIHVPEGFALVADAFRAFQRRNDLTRAIDELLACQPHEAPSDEECARIRGLILSGTMPPELSQEILDAYRALSRIACDPVDPSERALVAVRSSPTGEGILDGSLAGQHDSFLYVSGDDELLDRIRRSWASLFNPWAIASRLALGVDPRESAMSVGVQRIVHAEQGCSGVALTLDPDSGDRDVVFIASSWGLGENIVQGRVAPDVYYVHKEALRRRKKFNPVVARRAGAKELQLIWDETTGELSQVAPTADARASLTLEDEDVMKIARWAVWIEDHWSRLLGRETSMTIEWARDGRTGELVVLQARPRARVRCEARPALMAQPPAEAPPTPAVGQRRPRTRSGS